MAESSALSSLSRTPTPSSRYHLTADESASIPADQGDVTDISSPGDVACHDDSDNKAPYREAKDLSEELRARCQIHLEEQTYEPALNLLNSVLCDGISHSNASTKPGSVPPPEQLGLLATLAIHPKETSKLTSLAAHDIGALSLSVLRNVLATVGPVNGRLRDAFVFRGEDRNQRRSRDTDESNKNSKRRAEHIRGKMAGASSVWKCGQEFWNVLGWAFICSALYPHRWRWWKPWLEYMVDVLEGDYEERKRLDKEREGDQPCDYSLLRESLLLSYVSPKSSRANPLRHIMTALFADGSSSSTKIFKEVFKNETRVASTSDKKRKRRLDLDKDNYADYADDSSSGGSQPPTPEHQRTTAKTADDAAPWATSSLAETIPLRLRLFALLSRAVDDVPDMCKFKVKDLYQNFVEKIAQLPVPAFTQFISSLQNHLDQEPIVAIMLVLMPHIVPPAAPAPRSVDQGAAEHDSVSAAILEKCYLPFAYKTAENNAKLSLATETVFRILWTNGCLEWTPTLQHAVEKGIEARRKKSTPGRNRNDGDNATRDVLRASGRRLLALAELLRFQELENDGMDDDA